MRKLIYLFVLLTIVTITNLKAQNLVAYYKLDGNAYSFYGSANGSTSGTVKADTNRFNLQNSSLRFVSSAYATIPNSFDLAQKTFNFWLYVDTITSSVNLFTVDNGTLNHGMIYLNLIRNASSSKIQFYGGNTTPIETYIYTKRWYKISVTYSNSIYKLYLNNNLLGTVTSTNVHSLDGYQGIVLGNNRAFNNMSTLRGKIDDLSVYNYAMDSTQLANITQATCDFNNIINIYDTTNVTIVDTNYVTITDTNHVTIIDTNFVTIVDTNFLSVYDTLIVDILSSTNQTLINTIKVYPNPANDIININNGNFSTISNYTYEIKNSLGQIIFTHSVNSAQTTIDIKNWPEGIYFLNIIDFTGNLIEVKKIILK